LVDIVTHTFVESAPAAIEPERLVLLALPHRLWVYVDADNVAGWTDRACDLDAEAARTTPDVKHRHAGSEREMLEGAAVDRFDDQAPPRRRGEKDDKKQA
jgi:hypothetical protein